MTNTTGFAREHGSKKARTLVVLMAGAVALSGCVAAGPGAGGFGGARTPTFADGSWIQPGVAVYDFGNGAFRARAADTGNQLASGSYQYTGPSSIFVSGFSDFSQSAFRANCQITTPTVLMCSNDEGVQFSLSRA